MRQKKLYYLIQEEHCVEAEWLNYKRRENDIYQPYHFPVFIKMLVLGRDT